MSSDDHITVRDWRRRPLLRLRVLVDIGQVYRGVLPFVLINFVMLLVITYVPSISMVLIGHGP